MLQSKKRDSLKPPSFWENLYLSDKDGWDMRSVHHGLPNVYGAGLFGDTKRILVPGAGRGHDAFFLASKGFQVVACDFADTPIAAMKQRRENQNLSLEIRQIDVFSLFNEPAGSFDAIFDYTFYCAIDPKERSNYLDLVTHLIRPGGRLILFAFPLRNTTTGPPYSMSIASLKTRFQNSFYWILDETMPASPRPRRSFERLVLMVRK